MEMSKSKANDSGYISGYIDCETTRVEQIAAIHWILEYTGPDAAA